MKKWIKYIRPYIGYFVIGPLCMIVEVIGEVLMPKLLSVVINQGNAGTLTIEGSIGVCLGMAAIAVIMMLGGIGGAYFGAKASVNFASDVREDMYKKIQSFSFANIDRFSTGSLITRVTNDVTQIQNFVNMLLRMALRSPGMLIGGLIMATTLKPSLATVFTVSIPLMALLVGGIISVGFPRFQKMQTKVDALNSTVQENITNVRVVKSFVREGFETDKFRTANCHLKEAGLGAMRVVIFMQPVMTFFMYATIIAAVWFGHGIVLDNGMQVGDLSAFVAYVNQILMSLMMITFLLMTSSRALASARRIREVLDEQPDIADDTAAYPEKTVEQGLIEFRNVSYRYHKNSVDTVLTNINLTIQPRTTVGIIGSTGCGKSTLVSLISRLYDTDEGEVLIDGVNVRDYSLYNLREGVGMVLQKNVLFSGTIEENLRWGDACATDEEIRKAATYAQADKFVQDFPAQYQNNLEQGGANVSGGQKQRLCIARALLKKPRILILDDSTSAVDTATEMQIHRAFAEELSDSTKIIIAQRITSVMGADQIVVMDDGRITGIGTHEELLASNEEYREIYYSQMEKKGE